MRILGLTAALAIVSLFAFLAGSANAVTINPYVSGKVSMAEGQLTEKILHNYQAVGQDQIADADSQELSDRTFGTVRGYLAFGLEAPQPVLHGALRFEMELGFGGSEDFQVPTRDFPNDPAHLKVKATTLFFNGYYDFHATEKIKPYFGAGLGLARLSFDMNWSVSEPDDGVDRFFINKSESFNNFAYHLGAGVAYNLTENIALDLGYRYTDYGKVSMSSLNMVDAGGQIFIGSINDMKVSLHQNEVMLGLRYTF